MESQSANNKRIVKNTILLYGRMVLLMAINLYTSRVVLANLGVEDFGIYNVVGGIVAMFTMISGALSSSISRFITYELGTGNVKRLNEIFSTSVTIQIIFSAILIILAETIGMWFLNHKLVIPEMRMSAAQWVFQFSIIAFVINLISVPYNAAIIAHEKMSAFAYISIVEAIGKLSIAWLISFASMDKLVLYALLICAVAVVVRIIYGIYCARNFRECKYRLVFDKSLLSQMFSFAGWNMIGATSAILRDQGGNILINLFGGPVVNAARGIAFQVNHAILGFVQNFQTALNPQIIKNYASQNYDYMRQLVFQGSRFSYYILFFISFPIFVCTHYVLQLWLGVVPEHTVLFIRLVIVFSLFEALSGPLITAMYATGKVKMYQICVGGLQMLNFPISYLLLKLGGIPETIMFVAIGISLVCLWARLILLKSMIGISPWLYIYKVFFNCLLITITTAFFPLFLQSKMQENLPSFIILTMVSMGISFACILYVGCNQTERKMFFSKVKAIYREKFLK